MKSTLASLLVLASLLASHAAWATVPGQVSYQGLLLDDQGQPVTATVAMEFELFDAASGGSSLWFESHPAVQVVDGVYDVVLGAITPLDPGLTPGGSLHLEVTVEGETLTPRQALLVVPYALRAAVAEQAGSLGQFDSAYYDAIIEHVDFDGQVPGNAHPDEGTADTDGDTIPNFLDADNDNDGILDGDEVAQGSNINLPTPVVVSFDPTFAYGHTSTVVQVQGSNFVPGMTVSFGAESPTPANVTATSFDVTVGPQPEGLVGVTVTRPNGESTSAMFYFRTRRTIFATSTVQNGNLGGLVGADAVCQARADAAGLPGSYQAWLADGIDSPSTRESRLGLPYVDTTGAVIADDWADLTDGSIDNAISRDENGAPASGLAWTNVSSVGGGSASGLHCVGWSATSPNAGRVGALGTTSTLWSLTVSGEVCSTGLRLYCVEQ